MYSFENLVFFRGVSGSTDPSVCSVRKVRKDRRPRDTLLHLHTAADEWFLRKFGFKFRSQALFLTSTQTTATAYASAPENVYRIIPLDQYTFCWSPKISDMLQLIDATTTPEMLWHALDAADYRIDDLKSAHTSGNEVMLVCDQYISIPIEKLGYASVSPIIIAQSFQI